MKNSQKIIKDSIGWDIVNWSKSYKLMNQFIDISKLSNALELGVGHVGGGYSLYLASSNNINVVCSDFKEIDDNVKSIHKKHNVHQNITYSKINALDIPYENFFDIVVFKSILGGIARNDSDLLVKVSDQVSKSLKKNGLLFFSENIRSTSIHMFARNNFSNGMGNNGWRYLSIDEITNALNKNFNCLSYDTKGFLGCFGMNEVQRKILGNIDSLIFDKILPKNYLYCFFGAFIKR